MTDAEQRMARRRSRGGGAAAPESPAGNMPGETDARLSRVTLQVALAAVATVLGLCVLFLDPGVAVNVLAYGVGCLIPLFLVTFARRAAVRWQQSSGIALARGLTWSMFAILVLAVLSSALHAVQIARHLGSPL